MSNHPIIIQPPARLPMFNPRELPEYTFGTANRRVTYNEQMKIATEKKKTKNLAISDFRKINQVQNDRVELKR